MVAREGGFDNAARALHIPVKLYWHYWNLKSDLLEKLTTHLIRRAKTLMI